MPAPSLGVMLSWAEADWAPFAEAWERLGQDLYMADGGRYRRRRHGAFAVLDGRPRLKPHQPHFQSRDYNPLNGDVQRWFDPIEEAFVEDPILRSLYAGLTPLFSRLDRRKLSGRWESEVHQFRIESTPSTVGHPTPEGLHRDGVDWVLVMLVDRKGVAEGTTIIGDGDGKQQGRFTLSRPGDAVILDDRRIQHGVTPIRTLAGVDFGTRDALVITWSAGKQTEGDRFPSATPD